MVVSKQNLYGRTEHSNIFHLENHANQTAPIYNNTMMMALRYKRTEAIQNIYLPSGLFGEVRNMHFGFSCSTVSAMCSTFKLKSGFLGTAQNIKMFTYIYGRLTNMNSSTT